MKSSAMKQILWISVIAITSSISTAILIKSNGLQRTSRHEISTIQWTLDTPITSYTVDLPSTRLFKLQQKSERNENSHHYYDRARGVITLFLFNVELDDAGNYTLRVSTSDLTAIDTSACLFVYGDLDGQVALTVGSSAVTEGDHVELTCNFKSNSLPAAFRPNIHYSWDVESNWETIFKRLVEPDETWLAKREHGIKNNGQLLVIESVRYLDNQAIVCVGTEGGPEARETFRFSEFRHRPILKEEGKKIFSNIFHTINLDFNIDANPPVSNRSDWSFVNSNGVANSLPPSFRSSSSHFQFQLDSSVYYGNYSITLTNAVGSTTATIQVIAKRPPVVKFQYVFYNNIEMRFDVELSEQQLIRFQLTETETGIEVETIDVKSVGSEYMRWEPHYVDFVKNIQPERNYTVIIWFVNDYRISNMLSMKTQTPKRPQMTVRPENVFINESTISMIAEIELSRSTDQVEMLQAICCLKDSTNCVLFENINRTESRALQIVFTNLPIGTVFYVDIIISAAAKRYREQIPQSYRFFRNGILIGRTEHFLCAPDDASGVIKEISSAENPTITVILLSILLGVALSITIAAAASCMIMKSRLNRMPRGSLEVAFENIDK